MQAYCQRGIGVLEDFSKELCPLREVALAVS